MATRRRTAGAARTRRVGSCLSGAVGRAGVVAVVFGPLGRVAGVGVRPAEIEATVGERLEVASPVVLDHSGIQTSEGGIIILGHLCSRKGKDKLIQTIQSDLSVYSYELRSSLKVSFQAGPPSRAPRNKVMSD